MSGNLPQTPTRSRMEIRQHSRDLQSAISPQNMRRKVPNPARQTEGPPQFTLPIEVPTLPAVNTAQLNDPFYVPPPDIVPPLSSMPHELRPSQLRAQLAEMPPLQTRRRRGRPRTSNTLNRHVSNQQNMMEDVRQYEENINPIQNINNGVQQAIPHLNANRVRMFTIDISQVLTHSLGQMNVECRYCGALHWKAEELKGKEKHFGMCCLHGKFTLPIQQAPPHELLQLFNGQHILSKEFRKNIRMYNNAFAFTSVGVKLDETVNRGNGPYCFKIQGQLHHSLGSLLPSLNTNARFAQVYIYDTNEALSIRMQNNSISNGNIMLILQSVLERNPLAVRFKSAFETMQLYTNQPQPQIALRLTLQSNTDQRRYNLPTANEIAVLLPDQSNVDGNTYRDIILHLKDGPLQRISEIHPLYLPLHYVLLFPYGELGWHPHIELMNNEESISDDDIEQLEDQETAVVRKSKCVTQRQWYAYHLHIRMQPTTLFYAGSLFQQFIVDAWAQLEQSRLNWIKLNQEKIRIECYRGIVDSVPTENLNGIGKRIYLPSSFVGSARYMFQLLQDSLAIARYYQRIDYFITMTANPNWPEITAELLPGQKASDRPDLVARVFQLKKKALIQDIVKKNGILGTCVANIYTIEFQKRGLPHIHLLIIVDENSRLHEPEEVDRIIRAEFPNPDMETLLFNKVLNYMTHACSNRCLDKNKKCSKGFPKPFRETTSMSEDAYCSYRRRNDGHQYKRGESVNAPVFHNGYIVPYSPYLLLKYDCHINIECCASIKSVKYIHKYIYK